MIGSVVFFSDLGDPYRVVPPSDVERVFHGLLFTPPLTISAAVRYAGWHGWPFLIERLDKETLGLFEILVEGKKKARGEMIAWVGLDLVNDRVDNWGPGRAIDSETQKQVQAYVNMVDRLAGSYSGRQVRKAMIDAIIEGMAGVSLRDQGAVYFVPGIHRDRLVELARDARDLDLDVSMVDADRTEAGLRSLRSAAEKDLLKRAKEMRDRLAELKRFSAETLTERAAEITEMFKLADLYEGTLDFVLGDLRSELKAAKDILAVKLTEVK